MLDKIYFCPHNSKEKCQCRKPKTYFIDRAVRDLGIVKKKSFMIGDRASDIEFGKREGLKTVLLRSSRKMKLIHPSFRAKNFEAAVNWILKVS